MVIAGGLLRGAEALAAPTTHASFRQQNAVMAPVRCGARLRPHSLDSGAQCIGEGEGAQGAPRAWTRKASRMLHGREVAGCQ